MFFFVKIAFALLSFKRKAVQFCCLPPHGGSGLKSKDASQYGYDSYGLPPHGGSGLKYRRDDFCVRVLKSPSTRREWIEILLLFLRSVCYKSPSTRREWIEISLSVIGSKITCVSLHTEGVD